MFGDKNSNNVIFSIFTQGPCCSRNLIVSHCQSNTVTMEHWYLPNQWIAIFAHFDWLRELGISLDIHCFVNREKNGALFR